MPHELARKIHDKELLVWDVVARYFAQNKCKLFTQQLKDWDFKDILVSSGFANLQEQPQHLLP